MPGLERPGLDRLQEPQQRGSLVPLRVRGTLDHVVAERRDRDRGDGLELELVREATVGLDRVSVFAVAHQPSILLIASTTF